MKDGNNFYCQNECGSEDFSIDEWNKVHKELELTNMSEKEKSDILFPPMCEKQCFDCIAIVGSTRLKNKEIREKQLRNNKP